jgi:putative tryptophan/tyrosine transport system substrate-binding protein
MRRREFILLLSGTFAGAPLVVGHAASQHPRIGILTLASSDDPGGRLAAFVAGLRKLGYVEGKMAQIDLRYANGDVERLDPLARELIAMNPDVIYAVEPSAARAVKQVSPRTPIVCSVLTGHLPDLYDSYARPGGNVTGLTSSVEDMNGKLVELAIEIIPRMTRIGLLLNPNGAVHDFLMQQIKSAGEARNVETVVVEARKAEELASAFDNLAKAKSECVIVQPNGLFENQRKPIIALALAAHLPSFFEQRQDVEAGGLLSYGVNETEGSRRAAGYVDKILKGAKPADLPIEFPTEIELTINRKTANALGLNIPATVLSRADLVIE